MARLFELTTKRPRHRTSPIRFKLWLSFSLTTSAFTCRKQIHLSKLHINDVTGYDKTVVSKPGNKTKWKSCPRNNQTNFITTELILDKWWLTSFHLIKKNKALCFEIIYEPITVHLTRQILKKNNTILITHLLAWKHCQNNWVRDEKKQTSYPHQSDCTVVVFCLVCSSGEN